MSVRHTIAAGLAGLLMIEAAGLAQALPLPATEDAAAVVAIPKAQAVRVLLAQIAPGSVVRVELANGSRVEGTIVELSPDTLTVSEGRLRRVVAVEDISAIRQRRRLGMTRSNAFGVGAAIGGAAVFGLLFVSAAARR
jgi:hypothetical protein